jgi:hypothetical protein
LRAIGGDRLAIIMSGSRARVQNNLLVGARPSGLKEDATMTLLRLEKEAWPDFCQGVTRELGGKRAEIEIASVTIGAQIEAQWLPLLGVTYDRGRETLEIVLDGHDHLVVEPQELYADYGPNGLESVGILDRHSDWQIMLLRDPLMLPSPTRAAAGLRAST